MIDHDGRGALFGLRFVQREQASGARVDDVVRKNIVRQVPLHLEFTRPCARRVVVVQRIADHGAVLSMSPLGRVSSNGNTGGMAVIDKIISRNNVTGGTVLVLTG